MPFPTRLAAAATLLVLGALPALSRELPARESQMIDLGPVAGDAYFTVHPDGYHVVATFAARQGGTPMRVEALLAPGQSMVFSTPRAAGEQPVAVTIQRQEGRVVVRKAMLTD